MRTSPRTDLAVECVEGLSDAPAGVKKSSRRVGEVAVVSVEIETAEAAKALGKPPGRYVTLELTPFSSPGANFEGELAAVAEELARFLPERGLVLVAGLGNGEITPDAIGPKTAAGVLATRHVTEGETRIEGLSALRPVAVLAPGVLGQTGIETAELIRSVCERIRPAAVVAVDALASGSVKRLGRTVQLADAGIAPGSGVKNRRGALDRETLGVPVVAVGVPTVVDAVSLTVRAAPGEPPEPETGLEGCMVTPREIDVIVEKAASLLSLAINSALQPDLTVEELLGLTE